MKNCKILISGATGFIGRRLALQLFNSGYHISALYRNERWDSPQTISWVRVGDLSAAPLDPAIGRGSDVFVHLAATLRPTSDDPLQSQTAFIARNVSRFIAEAKIPRALVLSSIAASVTERDPDHARRYGREKLAAERIFLDTLGNRCQVIVLRPPAVYGAGMQNSMVTLAKMICKRLPIPLGLASEPRHYMSVNNLCDLIETMIQSDKIRWDAAAGQSFEPSDGQAVTTRDLIAMMGNAIGRSPRLVPVPLAFLRVLGAVTGRSEMISGAIDRLEIAPVCELKAAFDWQPTERMPESLAFLRGQVNRA